MVQLVGHLSYSGNYVMWLSSWGLWFNPPRCQYFAFVRYLMVMWFITGVHWNSLVESRGLVYWAHWTESCQILETPAEYAGVQWSLVDFPGLNMPIWLLSHWKSPGVESTGVCQIPPEHVGQCTVLQHITINWWIGDIWKLTECQLTGPATKRMNWLMVSGWIWVEIHTPTVQHIPP